MTLLRLARIVRAFRLFPSLRVILVGIRRSLPGLGSFLLITLPLRAALEDLERELGADRVGAGSEGYR